MYSKEKEIPVPMAVLKSFAEDVSGGIANMFIEMDEDERSEYIGSIVTDL